MLARAVQDAPGGTAVEIRAQAASAAPAFLTRAIRQRDQQQRHRDQRNWLSGQRRHGQQPR
jgi:hypothetical protein